MGGMVAREFLDDHRLAHAALADDEEVGHAGALGKRDQVLEHAQGQLRAGVVDPPVRANPAQTLVRTQGRDRAARGKQMAKILSHPIPPPRNRAGRAAYPPPAVRRPARPRSTSPATIWVGAPPRGASPWSCGTPRRPARAGRGSSRRSAPRRPPCAPRRAEPATPHDAPKARWRAAFDRPGAPPDTPPPPARRPTKDRADRT